MGNFSTILALAAAEATKGAAPTGGGMNPQTMMLLVGLMIFYFYIFFLRPQKRDRQTRETMMNSLKKGDKVVTIGGMHGWITEIEKGGKTVSLRVDAKTIIKFNRSAIASVERGEERAEAAEGKAE